MAAAYDTYDYPSYWEGREYEHTSEIVALKAFLQKIPKIRKILEVGAGFGRLTPHYLFRAKDVILVDPSARLLKMARDDFNDKKIRYIQSRIENVTGKVKGNTIDLIICVRVMHHLDDIEEIFEIFERLIKKNGYLILEFPNKCHLKAVISEFFKGNITFLLDIFPKELKTKKRKKTLPFKNYHPDYIRHKLSKHDFEIIEERSVSNIRIPFLKKALQTPLMLNIEKILQKPLSKVNFGPSKFILAKRI